MRMGWIDSPNNQGTLQGPIHVRDHEVHGDYVPAAACHGFLAEGKVRRREEPGAISEESRPAAAAAEGKLNLKGFTLGTKSLGHPAGPSRRSRSPAAAADDDDALCSGLIAQHSTIHSNKEGVLHRDFPHVLVRHACTTAASGHRPPIRAPPSHQLTSSAPSASCCLFRAPPFPSAVPAMSASTNHSLGVPPFASYSCCRAAFCMLARSCDESLGWTGPSVSS